VARNVERLQAGVQALEAQGIRAAAFPTDLSDPTATEGLIASVRAKLGPVTVLHWNAYGWGGGDVLKASLAELRAVFDVPVVSLLAALQAALPDLRSVRAPGPHAMVQHATP
jgi:NAD(P)-dependent dehydrogenase (short-subunit alcohol dehydrogenase family)